MSSPKHHNKTSNSSFEDVQLVVHFVAKNEENDSDESLIFSEDMKQAAMYLKDYISEDRIKWIHESEAIDLVSIGELRKKDIFVLHKFAGQVFEDLQITPALIIGPRCLLVCLLECAPIPFGSSPVFITSMRDLSISCSGFEIAEKNKMKNLILYMGGNYVKELNRSTNYLISNTIKSTKYEQAVIHSIPVMHSDWINAVWEAGQTEIISAVDKTFHKYKLPIFYHINISSSGLNTNIKDKIIKLVIENGGYFQRIFKSSQTDILITTKENINSDKFKAAVKYKKNVLIADWIFDSVEKGAALSQQKYKITGLKVSTPTKKEHSIADFTANCTGMSEISNINQSSFRHSVNIDDTIVKSNIETASIKQKIISTNNVKTYQDILKEICQQEAKKAGTFLDGCCICLSGFLSEEKEKLNKILNVGGATRYNEVNEKVTHIIVGQSISSEFASWNEYGAYIVTLDWILESIKAKQPVNELNHRAKLQITKEPEAPSPQSKKSLRSMNHSFKKPEMPKKRLNFMEKDMELNKSATDAYNALDIDNDQENDFLSHYSQENNKLVANLNFPEIPQSNSKLNKLKNTTNVSAIDLPPKNDFTGEQSMLSAELSENIDFFEGLTVYVDHNYDHEMYSQAIVDCETAHGKLVNSSYRDYVDYVIVSAEIPIDINEIPVKAKNIINSIWMEDAIRTNELVPIEYFHKPISTFANKKPLNGMTIVISAYDKSERLFLQFLVVALGAIRKDAYTRKEKPLLICPSTTTAKYNAALKWNFPVVKAEWLVLCSETGEMAFMEPFLVGNAKVGNYLEDININSQKNTKVTPTTCTPNKSKTNDFENIHLPEENAQFAEEYTPLRHKRIAELAGPSEKKLYCGLSTPDASSNNNTNASANGSPIFGDLDEFLKDISADDVRELCKSVLLDAQNSKTPEAEKLRRLARTPAANSPATPQGIPEFCRTPEFRKRMKEYVDKRWNLSVKKLKPNTPLAEVKHRLWRETLPADFVATCKYFQNDLKTPKTPETLKNQDCNPELFSPNSSNNSSTPLNLKNANKSFDENSSPAVKRLKDFLKNCEEERAKSSSKIISKNVLLEEESQGLPQRFESEMMFNSERMVGWNDPSDVIEFRCKGIKYKGVPRFSISSSTEQEKIILSNYIKELGGEIDENLNANYDPACTHIICEKPNRGEKFLSGVSAGKWILALNYIKDSKEKGYFLDEELYEWGNPKANNLPQLKKKEQTISNSSYYWRNKISSNSLIRGAFTGQIIILHISEGTKKSFVTLLAAGDGVVLSADPPYNKETILKATHCYVDTKKPLTKIDHKNLLDGNVLVLNLIAISSYLTSDPETDLLNFALSL